MINTPGTDTPGRIPTDSKSRTRTFRTVQVEKSGVERARVTSLCRNSQHPSCSPANAAILATGMAAAKVISSASTATCGPAPEAPLPDLEEV
jgi:hypothetical protein